MAHIVIIGPEAAAAQVFADAIAERETDCETLTVLSDTPYDAEELTFNKRKLLPQALSEFDFDDADIVILLGVVATDIIQAAQDASCFIIDCRTTTDEVAADQILFVPEVNGEAINNIKPGDIVRNPCSSSIFLSLLLKPLASLGAIRFVSVCCHLPAIRRGKEGVDELVGQTARLMNGMPAEKKIFSEQIAFNLLPGDSVTDELGYCVEETVIASEVRDILGLEALLISPTCIHAPVFYSQSMVVNVEFADPVSTSNVSSVLKKAEGVKLATGQKSVPTALSDKLAAGDVVVGRVKQVAASERQFNLWAVADELRKGVAVNAVQIAEILIKSYL